MDVKAEALSLIEDLLHDEPGGYAPFELDRLVDRLVNLITAIAKEINK